MGATKRMIENDPDWVNSERPALYWMEREYYEYQKQREHEQVKETEVDYEIVEIQEEETEASP